MILLIFAAPEPSFARATHDSGYLKHFWDLIRHHSGFDPAFVNELMNSYLNPVAGEATQAMRRASMNEARANQESTPAWQRVSASLIRLRRVSTRSFTSHPASPSPEPAATM